MIFRPIDRWPKPFTKTRKASRFKANFDTVLASLQYEIYKAGGNHRVAVIQLALRDADIRQSDGMPKAYSKPDHPGVIVSFKNGKNQELSFPCDRFTHWNANLYAIAKSLDALRMVDRYGVTTQGEQYRGWQALPPAPVAGSLDAEIVALRAACGFGDVTRENWREAYRAAVKLLHPDANGGQTLPGWTRLQAAKDALERAWG